MSTYLYRLGQTAFGRPWLFIAGWVAVLAAVVGAVALNGVSVSSEMKIEGTQAQTVLDRVADELPEASGGQASVVFTAPDGGRLDTPERLAVISRTVSDVYDLEKVVNPLDAALGGAGGGRQRALRGKMHRAIPQPGRTSNRRPPTSRSWWTGPRCPACWCPRTDRSRCSSSSSRSPRPR